MEYKTTNYRVVVTFIALGINEIRQEIAQVEYRKKNVFVYEIDDIVKSVIEKWRSGQPIMVDARKIFEAEGEFHLRIQNFGSKDNLEQGIEV